MPHAIAEPLFRTLLDAFPASRPYPAAFFEQDPMPPLVAHFLKRTLEDHLERDLAHLSAAPEGWFDEQHPDVQEAHRRLKQTLQRHARIPARVWAETLQQAVHRVATYLVQPVPTVTAFVFEDSDAPRSVLTILHRLGYFKAYPYLREAVNAYVEHKGVHELERERFASILRHIDQQMTEDHDADAWLDLLHPLFDLTRHTPGLDEGVPPRLLARFFAEKGREAIHQRLEARAAQRSAPVDADELKTILAEPAATEPSPARPAVPAPSAPAPADGPVPLWKQFQQKKGPAEDRPRPRPAPPTPSPASSAAPTPRWKQFQARPGGDSDAREPSSGPPAGSDISASLEALEQTLFGERGPKNRDLFVKHLFGGSLVEYERMLQRLRGVSDWKQASQLIAQDVFRKQQVNIYSEPAVAFTEAIEAHFRKA